MGRHAASLREVVEIGEAPETADGDNVKSLAAVLGCARSIESGVTVDVAELLAAAGRE